MSNHTSFFLLFFFLQVYKKQMITNKQHIIMGIVAGYLYKAIMLPNNINHQVVAQCIKANFI